MKILLTGGAGFLGSHVLERLLAANHAVTVLDDFNDYYDPAIKRSNLATSKAAKLVEGDICDMAAVDRAFADKPEAVIHLAARAGVRPSLENPGLYSRVNLGGTLNLLEACKARGTAKMVFASSSSVYGDNDRVPFREDDGNLKPISPYGVTKLVAEHYLRIYHQLHKMRITALRFFTIYGPRQRPDMAIHKFARLITDGKELPLFGDGSTRRDYTYVDDAVQGVLGALKRDDGFEVYNIGGSQTIELRRLVALLEENLGRKAKVKQMPDQAGDVKQTSADVSKAKERLGYAPATSFEAGIRNFCAWLKSR